MKRMFALLAALRAAFTLGVGALVVATGAFANTRTPNHGRSPTPPPPGGDHPARRGTVESGPRLGHSFGEGTFGGPLQHGEVVVGQGCDTLRMLIQQGRVTAVSGLSVTVRSSDGHTIVWIVTDDTQTGRGAASDEMRTPAVGDTVHAFGTWTDDGTAAAMVLMGRPADPDEGPSATSPGVGG